MYVRILLQVIARHNAVANAQPLVQHQTTSSGEKYALPEKLVAKNTQVSLKH